MSYPLSDEEKNGVLSAPDEKQYAYFLNKVADWGEVWGLKRGDKFASLGDSDTDDPAFPVWPHADFAEDDRGGGWEAYRPEPIAIHRFIEHLRALEGEGRAIAILHQPNGDYLEVPAGALADDLLDALDQVQ